ncbi:MAG: hypothetical protein ACRDPV_16060 [Gaiellaceae bacterium]
MQQASEALGYVNEYRRWYEMFVARAALERRANSDPLRGTKAFEIESPTVTAIGVVT